jgi:hypothetical protein
VCAERVKECECFRKQRLWFSAVGVFAMATPLLIDVVTLASYLALHPGVPLKASTAFTVLFNTSTSTITIISTTIIHDAL